MFILASNQMWFGQTPLFSSKKNKQINETNKKKDYILTKKMTKFRYSTLSDIP